MCDETTECSQCGCELDVMSVQHWAMTFNWNGEEGATVPICDRCYWDEYWDQCLDDDMPQPWEE